MCNHPAVVKLRRHIGIVTRRPTAQPKPLKLRHRKARVVPKIGLKLKHRKARAVPVTLTPCPLPASSFRAAEELAQLDTVGV